MRVFDTTAAVGKCGRAASAGAVLRRYHCRSTALGQLCPGGGVGAFGFSTDRRASGGTVVLVFDLPGLPDVSVPACLYSRILSAIRCADARLGEISPRR